MRTASSRRWRGLIASGVSPSSPQPRKRREPVRQPPRPAKNPTISCVRLRRRGDERHRGRRIARREPGHARDVAAAHRARHVEREQHAAVGGRDVPERGVERRVERVDDRRHRSPRATAADTAAERVRAQRRQHRDRVHPRAAQALRVSELLDRAPRGVGSRRQQPDAGHRRQVAQQRRHRHVGEQRLPHLGRVEVLGPDGLAREAVLGDQRGRLRRRVRRLRAGVALDQRREAVRRAAADDPLEQRRVLRRRLEPRVTRGRRRTRVGQAQQVAVARALALAVLDRLVGERVDRLRDVPVADRAPQRAAPAAELLDEAREREQVRTRPAHDRQRVQRRPARGEIRRTRRHREREDRRVVGGRPALAADQCDLGHRARPIGRDAAGNRVGVLARERPLPGVEGAALRAEDQEAAQPRPVIDGPREAAGRVGHLRGARDRRGLRRAPQAVLSQIGHGEFSLLSGFIGCDDNVAVMKWRPEPVRAFLVREVTGLLRPATYVQCCGHGCAHRDVRCSTSYSGSR